MVFHSPTIAMMHGPINIRTDLIINGVDIHVACLLYLYALKVAKCIKKFVVKVPDTKFMKIHLEGVIILHAENRHTERHDEASNGFSQMFFESP